MRKDPRTNDGKSSLRINKEIFVDFKMICSTKDKTPTEMAEDLFKRFIRKEAPRIGTTMRAKHA